MAQMPEASSALFMSQFTHEAVRDAIARVSSEMGVVLCHVNTNGESSFRSSG